MPKQTKPRPKNPSELIEETIVPYDLLGQGNPNAMPNRGNDVSVRKDTVKEISIRLIDLYEAIKYYIDNNIKPTVVENGQQISVPVQYVFPERWNAVQKEGFLRDKEGRLLLPMIVIKRDSIVRNRALGNKLDGNRVHQYQSFQTQYSRKNRYDNFSVLANRIPVKEYHIVPVPDYVIVTYNASILTQSQEQADELIQAFNFAADAYWGQLDRFKFKVNIESFSDIVEYTQGTDRSVRSNFNIVVNGYLLPDSVNRDLATQKKTLSKAQLKFTMETTTSDLEHFNASVVVNPNKISVTIIDSLNHQVFISGSNGGGTIDPAVVSYLSMDVELDAESLTENMAVFNSGFAQAPNGLPATSVSNFLFFANGAYIPSGSITSFVDNGNNTSTLTINTGSIDTGGLGYAFGMDWEITGRGKFQGSTPIIDNAFVDSDGSIWVDSDGGTFLIS